MHLSSDGTKQKGKPRRDCGCQSCRAAFGVPVEVGSTQTIIRHIPSATNGSLVSGDRVEVREIRADRLRVGIENLEWWIYLDDIA